MYSLYLGVPVLNSELFIGKLSATILSRLILKFQKQSFIRDFLTFSNIYGSTLNDYLARCFCNDICLINRIILLFNPMKFPPLSCMSYSFHETFCNRFPDFPLTFGEILKFLDQIFHWFQPTYENQNKNKLEPTLAVQFVSQLVKEDLKRTSADLGLCPTTHIILICHKIHDSTLLSLNTKNTVVTLKTSEVDLSVSRCLYILKTSGKAGCFTSWTNCKKRNILQFWLQ